MTWRKKYGTTHFQQHPKLSQLWRLMFIFAIFEIQISGDGLSRFMKLFTDTAVCQGDDEFSFRFAKKGFSIWLLFYKAATTSWARQEIQMQAMVTPFSSWILRQFLSKVPLEVLQNWVLIQLIVTPHILGKVLGQIKEVCRLIEPCLLIGTRKYTNKLE